MSGREPRRVLKIFLLIFGVLVLLAVGLVVLVRSLPQRVASVPLTLPDGAQVTVAGVTYGTNHVFGGVLARLAARLPSAAQDVLSEILGPRAVPAQKLSTASPSLVVWLKYSVAGSLTSQGWTEVYLADANGFVSGENHSPPSAFTGVIPIQFAAFPRRDRTLSLRYFLHDNQGNTKECGTLDFANPAYRAYPQWQPETLPATKRVGDVEATLTQVVTGVGNNMAYRPLDSGGYAIEYAPGPAGAHSVTACNLPLRSSSDTNQEWKVDHVEVGDATGNLLTSTGMSWSGTGENGIFSFSPALWTNEAAWKLRCEIKRIKGFATNELFTFKDVPLGTTGLTNLVGWTTNVNGVAVTLDYFVRRPPITNGTWSSTACSTAHFSVTGLSNDMHLDLVETRADNGSNVDCISWSTGGIAQERSFKDVPVEAKTLDFTFAVHQGRWVEFLVKPETGPARFEFPAPRKPKKPKGQPAPP